MKKKVLVVFGTRPEAIKMAPICMALDEDNRFLLSVCVTGQHRGLLDQIVELFKLKVDFDMDIMTLDQSVVGVAVKVMDGMQHVLREAQPDIVLVHGDTTTAASAAMASFLAGVPVGHIEAGLRTKDIKSPFPEEFNRRVITLSSDYHFAPTPHSAKNIIKSGIDANRVFITGNTIVDAVQIVSEKLKTDQILRDATILNLHQSIPSLRDSGKVILLTSHRRENFGLGLENICTAVLKILDNQPEVIIICPVHPNPQVSGHIRQRLGGRKNIYLIEPMRYETMCYLLNSVTLVLTDSGGLQEEAVTLGKPVLIMREDTERPEALTTGLARLVGTSVDSVVYHTIEVLLREAPKRENLNVKNPFGRGDAAQQIVSLLANV